MTKETYSRKKHLKFQFKLRHRKVQISYYFSLKYLINEQSLEQNNKSEMKPKIGITNDALH